jgi:tetratricopeptide (TPR) repeat protein
VRYDIGRLLQQLGRFEEAHAHLEYAALSAGPELSGWAWIRLGWEMDRAGRRDDAVAFYERAAKMKSFTFQPAASMRVTRPSTRPPDA